MPQDEKFENGGTMREADKRMYYIVSPNSFAYNPARINVGSIGYQNTGKNVIVSSLYEIFKTSDDVDDRLLWHWFKSPDFQKLIWQLQEGGVRLYFYYDKLCMGEVSLPSLEEQRKIGKFFDTLDNLITLHQRQPFLHSPPDISLIVQLTPPFYTFSWEQRKLEDYLTVSAEKNTGNIYGRSDVLSVSGDYGIVNQIEFQGRSFAGASVSNYGVVQTGDVVYTKSPLNSNPYGIIKTNKGKPGIVSTLYAVYHPKENAFSDFIQVYFEQHARMNNYMHPLVNKGAKNDMKVSAENALKGPVCFPSRIEQESISAFFSVLDNLITLHQRKFEKLTNVKKSMLEKMFPQNGCSYPEIRFKGFTDAWEQRKVSELAEKTYGGGTPSTLNEAYWDGDIPWIQSSDVVDGRLFGVVPRKRITQYGLNNSATQLVPKNSIAIITRVGVGKLAFMPYSYATSQDFLSLSKLNAEPLFTVYACYKKLQSELNAVQGTSIKGITKDELLAKTVMVPQYAEQQQIGAFFSQLDNLITLHQRELEKLQNIKKSMLEKMFI